MEKRKYRIDEKEGFFYLYEKQVLIARFTRSSFRTQLENLDRGSNWIGSILRLFLKKFPLPCQTKTYTKIEVLNNFGEDKLLDHVRSRGFRVFKVLPDLSDRDIIEFLESRGYVVEGLLEGDQFYQSARLVMERLNRG